MKVRGAWSRKELQVAALGLCLLASLPDAIAQTDRADNRGMAVANASSLLDELRQARENVRRTPDDANVRLQLAELLRKLGREKEAAQEYLQVTELDPSLYLAYHQLSTLPADPDAIDEGIDRLNKLKEQKPKELMLRVALSELLEKRQDYYQAARALIDIIYDNAVPEKYRPRVNARIHFLLTRAKDASLAQQKTTASDDELDVVPAPLPERTLLNGSSSSKMKEPREMKGIGHVQLLQ